MKKIAILGSTGSIGTQGLDIVRKNPEKFQVTCVSCGNRIKELEEQIKEFKPSLAVVAKEEDALYLKKKYPNMDIEFGDEGLVTAATSDCDMVLNSLMGIKGLAPTCAGIKAGKDIALANKETLVTGGRLVMDLVKENGVKLLPVDSEHSAIFQCLEGNKNRDFRRILLTCSGGPFRGYTLDKLKDVTLAEALKHPKWNMGKKITIDSATLMNKGLEVIEAKHLFGASLDQVQVVVHPQSIVHSAVEYMDSSIIAQLGVPDMRIPISLAFGYPDRIPSSESELNLFGQNLTFEEPDMETFKCLKLAFEAEEKGGSYPVVLNGANEVLVDKFLKGEIRFIQIQERLEEILEGHKPSYDLGLQDILDIDKEIREQLA
ncbi:MAG: 1-deoxy-D-xylulose-5-phosphate reductoisomerase [Clostridia bacterium]|nr:1-deoxy-D-xylulose-5-phosphate reductoisomerase [Clostridia bacterium]